MKQPGHRRRRRLLLTLVACVMLMAGLTAVALAGTVPSDDGGTATGTAQPATTPSTGSGTGTGTGTTGTTTSPPSGGGTGTATGPAPTLTPPGAPTTTAPVATTTSTGAQTTTVPTVTHVMSTAPGAHHGSHPGHAGSPTGPGSTAKHNHHPQAKGQGSGKKRTGGAKGRSGAGSPSALFSSGAVGSPLGPELVDSFPIPFFLLPIYQAAGTQYNVPWTVLAAINQVETDYGSNLSVSSAGAEGWMQFEPSTWKRYGLDADGGGSNDLYDPVDAIFAAAQYLHAAGASTNLRRAILAYNHSGSYADEVLAIAHQIQGEPQGPIAALADLNFGVFPVGAAASYDQGSGATQGGDAEIYAHSGAPVLASESGRIVAIGRSLALGRFVRLRDANGDTFTYGHLGSVARAYPAPAEGLTSAPSVAPVAGRLGAAPGAALTPLRAGAASASPRAVRPDGAPSAESWETMNDRQLSQLVLSDHRISIYPCGRNDIATGQIDRRVLGVLEFLADSGLDPTVSSLKCGHSIISESGLISEHSTGDAVDIDEVNGIPIVGHQGPGTITDTTIRRLLTLRGAMVPHQIISLMAFPNAPNTLVLPSHYNHIHIGYHPAPDDGAFLNLTGTTSDSDSLSPGNDGLSGVTVPGGASTQSQFTPAGRTLLLTAADSHSRRLVRGAYVQAGTVLGTLDRIDGQQPFLRFSIRPVSASGPAINPGPVLSVWSQLPEATINHVSAPDIGQAMLMDAPALIDVVLRDRRIQIYPCGRSDIANGEIDRRVLISLEYLADQGAGPVVTGLRCGHTALAYRSGEAAQITTTHPVGNLLAQLQGMAHPTAVTAGIGSVTLQFTPQFGANRELARPSAAVLGRGPATAPLGPGTITPLRGSRARARADVAIPHLNAQPVLGLPAGDAEVIGASPGEAPGEAWAQGQIGAVPAAVGATTLASQQVLMRYTTASGTWQLVPVTDGSGTAIPIAWTASEVTPAGGVALIGTDAGSQTLVTRSGGGAFSAAPAPPAGPTGLMSGESLYPNFGIPTIAADDDASGVGVFVAPQPENASRPGVLLYTGGQWTREPICASDAGGTCTAPSGQLSVSAVSASSPSNAWLIGTTSSTSGRTTTTSGPQLFLRQSTPTGQAWVQQTPSTFLLGSGPAPAGESVALPGSGPILTAVGTGVWVDLSVAGDGTDASVFVTPSASGQVGGTWCFPTSLCPGATGTLGAALPSNYGSFAFPGAGGSDPGDRIITGLDAAAELVLSGSSNDFAYTDTAGDAPNAPGGGGTFGPGGETLTSTGSRATGGAAFDTPTEGWLGTALLASANSPVQQTPEVVHVTTSPGTDQLTQFPAPFRYPLLAVIGQPDQDPGAGTAEALAVGSNGEVARYHPGVGWVPEFLYNGSGVVQTPTLRGVAWPSPDAAYAVGDNGAMWYWNGQTQLWEPDPAKPLNFQGNLTGIAFDPNNPAVGYAVGKQGVLLQYGKSWTQQTVPAAVAEADFTSVAFAGDKAIVGYRMLNSTGTGEEGGLLINSGSGWQIDSSAQSLLSSLPVTDTIISKVAGLPDGGAVAAGPGLVIERDSGSSAWRFSASPLAEISNGNVSALAAYRDGGSVRALVSVDDDPGSDPNSGILYINTDNPPAVSLGQPPLLIGPDPLPSSGYLVKETGNGWVDQEYADFPNVQPQGSSNLDLPEDPDPVLAILTDGSGSQGWAVGGMTGGDELQLNGAAGSAADVQTSGLQRFGGGVTAPVKTNTPMSAPTGQVTIALGGGTGCAAACADNAAQGIGPDNWLQGALSHASQIGGLSAFMYVGQPLGSPASILSGDAYGRELDDFDTVLGSAGTTLPVYAAATPDEVNTAIGGAGGLANALGSHLPAGQVPAGTPAPPAGTAAYAFDTSAAPYADGSTGSIRVIVLDYSQNTLSGSGGAQLNWLETQLSDAAKANLPAIVVGSDSITNPGDPDQAVDAATVEKALLTYGASAYLFFDDEGANVTQTIGSGEDSIPAYGTGTLGYVSPPINSTQALEFLGASGYLLVSVNATLRSTSDNRAPVSAQLIPNTGELALDAVNGTLLRRSTVSLFDGLARRPLGGEEFIAGSAGSEREAPDPYTTLPETCLGANCSEFLPPQYTFTSSNPEIGNFVEHDPNSTNPLAILQNSAGAPIADPASGLFCAFNPGTTTVSIEAGGLSYSEQVTVQGGSAEEPCGTVPVSTNTQPNPGTGITPPVVQPHHQPQPTPTIPINTPPPPQPQPQPKPQPKPAPAPKPAVHTVLVQKPLTQPVPQPLIIFPIPVAQATPPRALFPVSALTPRPTPPGGFGSVSVTSPVSARVNQEEKEREEATETSQAFSTYHPDAPPNPVLPGAAVILLMIALSGGGVGLRRRFQKRGAAAFARTEVRGDHDPWRRRPWD